MENQNIIELKQYISKLLDNKAMNNFNYSDAGVYLLRHDSPSNSQASLYNPLICVVLQGEKIVETPLYSINIQSGQSLLVTHPTPITSKIITASPEEPYIALVFQLNLEILSNLGISIKKTTHQMDDNNFALSLANKDDALIDALKRYIFQLENPDEHQLLNDITMQEIHARLLLGGHFAALNAVLSHNSISNRIFQVTNFIQENLSKPLVINDITNVIGMSNSAFFEHFKKITGTTPLQYQKDLRLLHAQKKLRTGRQKISAIAYELGYNSQAQFSREYLRKFGISPRDEYK